MDHPFQTPAERFRLGAEARRKVPAESHAELPTDRARDPVRVLTDQIPSRVAELVPIRHARMMASPFSFYRGGAAVMAGDLAPTPVSGFYVQLCGDAHLSNFGMFASPERRLVFDINDFDETLPGPWEWDLKRLATSIAVAGRQNGLPRKKVRAAVVATVRGYRDTVAHFAELGNLEVWYAKVDVLALREQLSGELGKRAAKRLDKTIDRARRRDHRHSLEKLTEVVDGGRRIIDAPPLVVRAGTLVPEADPEQIRAMIGAVVQDYAGRLEPGHRELVRSYELVDLARKVVGVGSVGTRCWIVYLRGRDDNDPLFLQVKEAQPSVLAAHLGPTAEKNEAARVVSGQRVMQATGDVFLGWTRTRGMDGVTRDFYVRQLNDWKGSVAVEELVPRGLALYGRLCAWTLARAHARSGDRIAVAGYLDDGDAFPHAIADFAEAYADLNERDHAAFSAAVRRGDLPAATGALT
jgi:uncharacterized protein (DUF2252 family)